MALETTDTFNILKAVKFAAQKHAGQRRKDPRQTPYVNHCIDVATLLTARGITEANVLIAALLHDTVEDTDTKFSEIEEQFGTEVVAIVKEVTDDKKLPSQDRKRLQIEHAPQLTKGASLIKLADKTCNLRDLAADAPVGWSMERKLEYVDWACKVVDGLRGRCAELEADFDEAARHARLLPGSSS